MILSDARTRIRRLMDDEAKEYATDAACNEALAVAQEEVMLRAIASGANLFTQEVGISTSAAGVADLTTIKPLDLVNVALYQDGYRQVVLPATHHDALANYSGVQQLRVAYVPRPTFPASDGASFVWGHANVTATNILDQLTCAVAASELKIGEGEVNKGLEARKTELLDALSRLINVPSWSVLPFSYPWEGHGVELRYLMTAPDTLQLVW